MTEWVVSRGAHSIQNYGQKELFPEKKYFLSHLSPLPLSHCDREAEYLHIMQKRIQRRWKWSNHEYPRDTRLTGKYNSSSSGDLRFLMDVIWMPCVFWRKADEKEMQVSSWEHFWSNNTCIKQTIAPATRVRLEFLVLSIHLIVMIAFTLSANLTIMRWG